MPSFVTVNTAETKASPMHGGAAMRPERAISAELAAQCHVNELAQSLPVGEAADRVHPDQVEEADPHDPGEERAAGEFTRRFLGWIERD